GKCVGKLLCRLKLGQPAVRTPERCWHDDLVPTQDLLSKQKGLEKEFNFVRKNLNEECARIMIFLEHQYASYSNNGECDNTNGPEGEAKTRRDYISNSTVRRRLAEANLKPRRPASGPKLEREHRVARLKNVTNV
ncbi:Transposable element Tcb2 transposase, partial [Operophtera brumata]